MIEKEARSFLRMSLRTIRRARRFRIPKRIVRRLSRRLRSRKVSIREILASEDLVSIGKEVAQTAIMKRLER